ncbi:MAG: hypothetical protein GX422_16655 [Deltaproteobacteria bacterium]|nr:hypothetical protein [Deltaproteobacteria bacterium]
MLKCRCWVGPFQAGRGFDPASSIQYLVSLEIGMIAFSETSINSPPRSLETEFVYRRQDYWRPEKSCLLRDRDSNKPHNICVRDIPLKY